MTQYEEKALKRLPKELADSVKSLSGLCGSSFEEIRLRVNKPIAVTANGRNIFGEAVCTEEMMELTVKNLCDNSLYSHLNTIREGYIDAGEGIRAGICGQAVMEDGRISIIKNISSVNIRIPKRIIGAADSIYRLICEKDHHANVLIYSKPGIGKTTILRELAIKLSSDENPLRTAVVDTRSEICAGTEEAVMLDALTGYPRNVGIETAVRTLSPQYIICDEIVTQADADAMITALGSGVHLCASVHGESRESLNKHPIIKKLMDNGVFDIVVGLIPVYTKEKRYRLEITDWKEDA